MALHEDGTVWAWGNNSYGQLGDGTTDHGSVPVQTTTGLSGVVALAAGGYHSLALMGDGTAKAWGRNGYGQLGYAIVQTLGPGGVGYLNLGTGSSCPRLLWTRPDGRVAVWKLDASNERSIASSTAPCPDGCPPAVIDPR